MVFLDQLLIDPRILAVEAFHVPERTQLAQVLVALGILCQQQLVVALVLVLPRKCFLVSIVNHIELATHDRFHLRCSVGVLQFARFRNELEHPEHVAVVGDR